jgi:hypothetical protein
MMQSVSPSGDAHDVMPANKYDFLLCGIIKGVLRHNSSLEPTTKQFRREGFSQYLFRSNSVALAASRLNYAVRPTQFLGFFNGNQEF